MSINSRIRQVRGRYFNDSNRDLAVAVNKRPNQTSAWVKEGSPVGIAVLESLQKVIPTLNMSWLMNGVGMMDIGDVYAEAELKDNLNTYYVPLVSQYGYAGYLSGFMDEVYMETLPKVPIMAEKEHKGDYLCFEVRGDSMEEASRDGIYEGDLVVGRNIDQAFWKSKLHINKWDFVIVHKTDGIIIKRIIDHNPETGDITIHSLNPMYEDRVINLSEVAQLFNIVDVHRSRRR